MHFPLIIVPVFNALEYVENCLASLSSTVQSNVPVLIIDDASTDERIQPLLKSWVEQFPLSRQLVTHDRNQGFVATANHGMSLANSDVILLNSDTEVTDGWLQRLTDCLAADQSIATATPWSNNGEIVSIPEFCQPNPRPRQPDKVASVIAACGQPVYPELPTAVGFCMAISLRALNMIGMFDETTFGHGYGEENDFCQRAIKAGFKNVLCDDAYVVHHGNASFGPLGLKPDEESMRKLLSKHPEYLADIQSYIQNDPLAARREQILEQLEREGVGMR